MSKKIGRNDSCPCGSGKKFKKCCLPKVQEELVSGQHEKRMKRISSVASPPPCTKEYEMFKQYLEKNPDKRIKKEEIDKIFTSVIAKVKGFSSNGANLICDKNLRHFYDEFNSRLFSHGLWSFPTSFNVMEAFMTYIPPLNYFELIDEKDFIFSFDEFLDFVTSGNCIEKLDEALHYFEEGVIYNFNNADDPKKLTIKNTLNEDFGFAGVSFIRHEDEISLIMILGKLADLKIMDKEIQQMPVSFATNDPAKKGLKPGEEYKREAGRLGEDEALWQTMILTRFDLTKRTQHVRYIMSDLGDGYKVATDDRCIFQRQHKDKADEVIKNMLVEINDNGILFELCKVALFLPYYFDLGSDEIKSERHPTELKSVLTDEEIKNYIDLKNRLFYRNVAVLKTSISNSANIRTVKAPELKIETTGFWKQLLPGQKGVDKNGNEIHGKTWVKQQTSWRETDKEEPLSVFTKLQLNEDSSVNTGYVYVMRSAAHEKDIFKIGLTRRGSEIRSDELSRATGSPDKFLVVEEWKVDDCVLAEAIIQKRLDKFRLTSKREFFKAPYQEIRKVIEEVTKEISKSETN